MSASTMYVDSILVLPLHQSPCFELATRRLSLPFRASEYQTDPQALKDPVLPLGGQLLGVYSAAIKMAVQMAERSPLHALPESSPMPEDSVTDEDIQLSRELLHWYWASFSLSLKARQSTMLRQTHLVEASVRILEATGDYNDMSLIQWVKLVRIAADAVLALHQGHTQETAGLSDDQRDGILDTFETKRRQWLVECPFDLVNGKKLCTLVRHYLISPLCYLSRHTDLGEQSR